MSHINFRRDSEVILNLSESEQNLEKIVRFHSKDFKLNSELKEKSENFENEKRLKCLVLSPFVSNRFKQNNAEQKLGLKKLGSNMQKKCLFACLLNTFER